MATFMRGGNEVVHFKKSLEVIKSRMDTVGHSWETLRLQMSGTHLKLETNMTQILTVTCCRGISNEKELYPL